MRGKQCGHMACNQKWRERNASESTHSWPRRPPPALCSRCRCPACCPPSCCCCCLRGQQPTLLPIHSSHCPAPASCEVAYLPACPACRWRCAHAAGSARCCPEARCRRRPLAVACWWWNHRRLHHHCCWGASKMPRKGGAGLVPPRAAHVRQGLVAQGALPHHCWRPRHGC